MSVGIAHDLSRRMQQSLADVLMREIAIAQHACTLPEIALMLIEASVMMARTAAGTIANSIDDDSKVEQMIDDAIDGITGQIKLSQPDIVTKVMATRQARAA